MASLCRDRGARGARQALLDLVTQDFAGLIQQIELDQPVGQQPGDFVAAPADRQEFLEVVEQCQRFDARQLLDAATAEQLGEALRGLVMHAPRQRVVRVSSHWPDARP
jgi:hypothetical protein